MKTEQVTLVTRNDSPRQTALRIVGLILYAGFIYNYMEPGKLPDRFNAIRHRITHQLSVWRTMLSIKTLPETEDPHAAGYNNDSPPDSTGGSGDSEHHAGTPGEHPGDRDGSDRGSAHGGGGAGVGHSSADTYEAFYRP